MSTVVFKQVEKSYGDVTVIKNLSFSLPDGAFLSLLGPSGCGKTTALRMVAGLERNTAGQIIFNDQIVSDPKSDLFVNPEKRHIGMVFQSYAVWPHMNVFENVAYPLRMQKLPKTEVDLRVWDILKLVELDGLEKRMPNMLSGGQQQRVALARGLVMRPQVLLLDEPLSNLDAKLREKMREDIRNIQQKFKMTCLYVTHDQVEAFSMSDLIGVMKDGDLLQFSSPQELRTNPANDFVANFIR